VLLIVTPFGSATFWLTAAAVAALAAMHVTYWLMTHPVNNFWLKETKVEGVGAGFFRFDPLPRHGFDGTPDWIRLRNRWEFSHVIRACLGLASLVLLVTAVAA
jgi:hypothetical protein